MQFAQVQLVHIIDEACIKQVGPLFTSIPGRNLSVHEQKLCIYFKLPGNAIWRYCHLVMLAF